MSDHTNLMPRLHKAQEACASRVWAFVNDSYILSVLGDARGELLRLYAELAEARNYIAANMKDDQLAREMALLRVNFTEALELLEDIKWQLQVEADRDKVSAFLGKHEKQP